MTETAGLAGGWEVQEFNPSKPVINTVVALGRLAFHPQTHFEDEEAIRVHRDRGGVLQILMTHFHRLEPLVIAQLAGEHESMSHLKYTTGVTARAELWDVPGLGIVLRNVNAAAVSRVTERADETPEEKAVRQEKNQQKMAIAGAYMAHGYNWLVFPEGSTRAEVDRDGQKVRVPRDTKTLLPVRKGFAYSIDAMPEEARANVKLLAIASYFGERALSLFRPTVHVSRPVSPVDGTVEDIRQQGEDLLRHSFAEATRLDTLR